MSKSKSLINAFEAKATKTRVQHQRVSNKLLENFNIV